MTAAKATCSPGSHPHADRPNWQPAETLDDYLRNCREGLETYSDRSAAKLMGISRVKLWRWKQMANIPEDLFERLISSSKEEGRPPSNRELASIGAALAGKTPTVDSECCPHCGEVLRVRGPWRRSTAKFVNDWLQNKVAAS